MQVRIDGRHFTVTPDIKNKIEEGVGKFDKFLHNIIEAHFILEIEKYRYITEVVVFAKNIVFKCREVADDMHLSVEKALHNIEYQLRQHKAKVKEHQPKHSNKEIETEMETETETETEVL
ncbi:MAG: ribosome-associated translation inhibitor RaiA [Candidatus Omnitrophota bacterium]